MMRMALPRLRGFWQSLQENLFGYRNHNHSDNSHADNKGIGIKLDPYKASQRQKIQQDGCSWHPDVGLDVFA